ncbi:MAG: Ig-like domain-containing protein [Lachnospiraceae bacterium]|nr:Ig-like domain-containing protein [Lachnospiraceae bacterium]
MLKKSWNRVLMKSACLLLSVTIMGSTMPPMMVEVKGETTNEGSPESVEDESFKTGKCGENVKWSLDEITGELIISGKGDMYDYSNENPSPFDGNVIIQSVVIKEGVTSIGDYAFHLCKNIGSVVFSDTVKTIGTSAFHLADVYSYGGDNPSLKNIILSDSVETIKKNAFHYSGVKYLYLSKSVKEIDESVFVWSEHLDKIEVSPENPYYSSKDGILYTKDYEAVKVVPAAAAGDTLILPENTKYMEGISFFVSESTAYHIKRIVFPEVFQNMYMYSFTGLPLLESLVFLGNPPEQDYFYDYLPEGFQIYCSFSNDAWKSKMEQIETENTIQWIDLDNLSDEFLILAEQTTVNAGGNMKLEVQSNPAVHREFVFSSSNPEVASVSDTGFVHGIQEGTAVITVSSPDTEYTASIEIHVSGETYEFGEHEIFSLEENEFEYTSQSEYQIIPYESLNGFYLYKVGELFFYSLESKKMESVYKFGFVQDTYFQGEKMYILKNDTCEVFDLNLQKVVLTFEISDCKCFAIGADQTGRIYIGGTVSADTGDYKLLLYSSEGTLLSAAKAGANITRFAGFDSESGAFYMEIQSDYYAYGFSHPGTGLTMGKVTDQKVEYIETKSYVQESIFTREIPCIEFLGLDYSYQHHDSAALLGDRYLTVLSTFTSSLNIYDTDGEEIKRVISESRRIPEYELESEYYDSTCIGVGSVYNEKDQTILMYENGKKLVEFDPKTGEKISSVDTAHYVFHLMRYGKYVIAIEKEDNQYYMEIFQWDYDDVTISLEPEMKEMKVGDMQKVNIVTSANSIDYAGKWTSSNNRIATVTKEGKVAAWTEGEVTIYFESEVKGLSAECKIRITPGQRKANSRYEIIDEKQGVSNVSRNNYSVWANTVKSYLFENNNKTLTIVEEASDAVTIRTYSEDYRFLGSSTIEKELPYFGGFFSGEEFHYIVFGQENTNENDETEVIRIVKYSKDWERLGSCSVKGANTYMPFDAGSLRMTETAGKLYVYTCHTMYNVGDGYHHQANMTFVVDEKDLTLLDSYSDVMNISYGYVSHSFNQLIATDGEYVYRVDHGDAYPRAVVLTRCRVDGSITRVSYRSVLGICNASSDFYNATGVSIGGMALSQNNCLIVGNSVAQDDPEKYNEYGQRNIFLSITDKDLKESRILWLTDYENGKISPMTPQIVKIDDEHFLVLWEEYDDSTNKINVKSVAIDSDGNVALMKTFENYRLSDCQPFYASDGMVKWYVSDVGKVVFYEISPYFTFLYGDVNEDEIVDVKDSALIKRYLAGWDVAINRSVADVNVDGMTDVKDSALIKRYLAGWDVTLGN